jgi:hypothetical protein
MAICPDQKLIVQRLERQITAQGELMTDGLR